MGDEPKADRAGTDRDTAAQNLEAAMRSASTSFATAIDDLEREAVRAARRVRRLERLSRLEPGLLLAGGVLTLAAALSYLARSSPIELVLLETAVLLVVLALLIKLLNR